ncbi:MAG: hypothetical protein GXY44_11315 [Phycisphaerales bacterium]|nr:hypothetical protein [Phycisphaerales bacterium]
MNRQGYVPIVLLTVLAIGWLGGCPSATNPDNETVPEGTAAPNAADIKALKEATARYATLLETQEAVEARNTLVDELNNGTSGVTSAGLANDNYTIVMAFESGARAGINTIEGFGTGDPYDPQPMEDKVSNATQKPVSAKGLGTSSKSETKARIPGADALLHTPTSRKILFLSAASEDLDGADIDLFESLQTRLVFVNHWDPADFTVKVNRPRDDYATLRFRDFFNLDPYGVIVIIAHGLYMDVTRTAGSTAGGTSDPSAVLPPDPGDPFNFGFKAIRAAATGTATRTPRYFIQVAAAGPVVHEATKVPPDGPAGADPFGFGFKPIVPAVKIDGIDVEVETAKGRLLIVSHANRDGSAVRPYYYMRDDLWKERLVGPLPNSLVYIASPNAYANPEENWPDLDPAGVPSGADPFGFGFKRITNAPTMQAFDIAPMIFGGSAAGTLLAWTGAVDTQTALDAVWLIGMMARRNESDRETWNSGEIQRAAAKAGVPRKTGTPPPSSPPSGADPYGFGFKHILPTMSTGSGADSDFFAKLALHSKTENAFLYLPTWADVQVLDPLPAGTAKVRVTMAYESMDIPPIDPDTLEGSVGNDFTFEGLIPGQIVNVNATALNASGMALAGFEQKRTLQSGGNPIEASFARELSVTLSGSPDYDGDWGNREDLTNKHNIHTNGFSLLVYKNDVLLSPNFLRYTDRPYTQIYPPGHLLSHDKILSYSGWNPAYPGDIIKIEFRPDPKDGNEVARMGPLYLHYWNDTVHGVVEIGIITGHKDGPFIYETVKLGD